MCRLFLMAISAFSLDWWLWLAMTGVAIGIVSSIKWVGLFVTALVGLVNQHSRFLPEQDLEAGEGD